MGRIRVLSDNVANKIAAGEVVERPASVVKELLENSLDAGASSVRVDVEGGGRRLIRISDDGCGMLRDDAMLAFERHATSKLHDVNDLLSIATLGFRGEALPSIASVSRLVLETRAREEQTGALVEIAGGKMLKFEEAALAPGTVITVRDLFFNVPARKKFLRTEQTELAHIASLVTHYSLAHPDKTFQLTHGANELLRVTPVTDLRDRVYQVFGNQVLEDLVDLEIRESELKLPPAYVPPSASVTAQAIAREGEDEEAEGEEANLRVFCLRGFVSRPQVQKSNRNSIYLFVNGRLIRDKLLMHAISSAFHNLIPPGCYPFALLFLDCDAREVDVNVHPSKTEVRFRHGTHVHDFVRDTIRERLIESRPAPSFYVPGPALMPSSETPQPGAQLPYSEFTQQLENERLAEIPTQLPPPPPDEQLPVMTLGAPNSLSPRFEFSATRSAAPEIRPLVSLPVPDTHGAFPVGAILDEPGTLASLRDLRPMGQLHESFIIAAGRDGLWIIDQHVAHERILFEQVLKQGAAGRIERQQLLMPILIELSQGQQIEYARIAGELNHTGFDTELFGARTIAVKAAPAGIGPADIEKLIYEVLEISEKELRRVSLDDLRRGIAASVACRAAIKINMRLDHNKMEWLLAALAATDCPMSCPHGRPVALRYSMRDILKNFHRI